MPSAELTTGASGEPFDATRYPRFAEAYGQYRENAWVADISGKTSMAVAIAILGYDLVRQFFGDRGLHIPEAHLLLTAGLTVYGAGLLMRRDEYAKKVHDVIWSTPLGH